MESSNFFKESAFAIIYLFHIHPPVTPTAINLALWFLPVMFTVQMFHYMIDKLTEKRWIMVSIAIIFCIISVILEKNDVSEWCYLNATVKYYIFYLSGSMTGIKMLKFFENKRYAILVLLFSLFAYFLLFRLRIESEIIMYMIDFATVICFIVFIFTFFRFAENFRIFNLLKFWGQHSLEVLVTHMLIIPVVTGVTARCLQSVLLMDLRDHQWLFVFLVFMICVLLEVPVIWFCNRFLQPLLGKKPLMVWGRG
jgi:hypothetical protein